MANWWKKTKKVFGAGSAVVGNKLHLPDFGVSERLANYTVPKAQAKDTRPIWQKLGYRSLDDYKLDNGIPTSTGQMDHGLAMNALGLNGDGSPMYPINTPAPNAVDRYPTTPLSSPSTAPTTTLPSYTWWMGNRYDMNNPNEQQSYVNSKKNWYDTNYDRSLTENKNNYDVQMSELGTNLEDLQKAYENRNQGIGSYYQRIAPNIYQSAEGEALRQSEEGLTRSTGEVAAERKRLGDWWSEFQGDMTQQKQDFYDSLNNALEEQAAIDYQNQIEQGMKPTYKRPASVGENVTKGMQGFNAPSAPLTQGQQRQQGSAITGVLNKIINGQSLTAQELQLAQEYGIA